GAPLTRTSVGYPLCFFRNFDPSISFCGNHLITTFKTSLLIFMRPFVFGIYLLIAVACSGNKTEDATNRMRFSVNLSDTLFVDPGDEILYLQDGLAGAQLADDGRYLYNFDRRENAVEVIDLDQLKLERKIR